MKDKKKNVTIVLKKKSHSYFVLLIISLLFTCYSGFGQIRNQKATNWCWAACIQSVLEQDNRYYSQSQIAASLDGWPKNRPAHINEVVSLLRFYRLKAWSTGRVGNPTELYNTLRDGWKVIAFVRPGRGMIGHYIVLQGFTPNGYIVVSDPANGYTFNNTLNDLYYGWYWENTIIVGR